MSMGKRESVSIIEAARISGIGKRTLRRYMRTGILKGYISSNQRVFKPSLFSVFHHLLGYPAEAALQAVAAYQDRVGDNGGRLSVPGNGRPSLPRQSRPRSAATNSRHKCEGQQNEGSACPPSLRPASTNRTCRPDETSPGTAVVLAEHRRRMSEAVQRASQRSQGKLAG